MLGPASGSTFAALVPGAAIFLAALLPDEMPQPTAVAGLTVATFGMTLTLVSPWLLLRAPKGLAIDAIG